jgi:hypothetical protein
MEKSLNRAPMMTSTPAMECIVVYIVDAQRISAEGTGDGFTTPEEDNEIEENTFRIASSPGQEISSPLRKMNTRQSTIPFEESNAGVILQTEYSLFYWSKRWGLYILTT